MGRLYRPVEISFNGKTKITVGLIDTGADETYDAMKKSKARDIAHFYTGEIPKKGYAVAFLIREEKFNNSFLFTI